MHWKAPPFTLFCNLEEIGSSALVSKFLTIFGRFDAIFDYTSMLERYSLDPHADDIIIIYLDPLKSYDQLKNCVYPMYLDRTTVP